MHKEIEINDLRKENKKLLQELHDMRYKKEIEELKLEIERLNKECDTYMEVATRKARRVREAIEYIEKNYYDTIEDYKGYVIATIGVEELLNILKGEE